ERSGRFADTGTHRPAKLARSHSCQDPPFTWTLRARFANPCMTGVSPSTRNDCPRYLVSENSMRWPRGTAPPPPPCCCHGRTELRRRDRLSRVRPRQSVFTTRQLPKLASAQTCQLCPGGTRKLCAMSLKPVRRRSESGPLNVRRSPLKPVRENSSRTPGATPLPPRPPRTRRADEIILFHPVVRRSRSAPETTTQRPW